MYIKEVDGAWDKRFTNRAGSTPLMYRRAVKVIAMSCFLSREADFLIRLRRDLSSGTVRSVQS